MKKISYLLLMMIVAATVSCDRSSDYDIEYLPFQEEEDGRWGLIAPDGKVLCSEEFKFAPTVATCGRFWSMNKDGYYELYTTSKKPERLGSEYRYVSPFYKGKAIVAERDKHMSIVNKSGETVVSLEKIDKYRPDYITNMNEGHAVFAVDTLQGVVNYDGEMIVKPDYYSIAPMHDGMVVAVDRNYAMTSDSLSVSPKMPKGYLTVINRYGEKVLKISNKKYPHCAQRVYGEYLPVAAVKDSTSLAWGIIDMKGNEIVKPSVDNATITEVQGKTYIYMNRDGLFGVKDFTGQKIIEPKYDHLTYVVEGIVLANVDPLSAMLQYHDDTSDPEGKYMSLTGDKLPSKKYVVASAYIPTACKYAIAMTDGGKWYLLDRKGGRIDKTPRINMIGLNMGDETIMSDYIDIDTFLANVGFSAGGVDSLSFNSGVQTVLDRQARHFSSTNKPKPADLLNTSTVYISRTVDGQNVMETITFPTNLSHRTYRTETVYDYDYYYNYWGNYWDTYWYSYNRQVPAGYEFSSATPSKFEMSFDNYGVLRGKLKQLYSKLAREFKKMGTVVDENNSAVLVHLNTGSDAVIYIDGHNVVARWGALSQQDKEISTHAGAKETISVGEGN